MTAPLLTADDIRARLRAEVEAAGSQRAWALMHGVSEQYVSDALIGRRRVGALILRALGLERVDCYRHLR